MRRISRTGLVVVPAYKWSKGRNGTHPGYTRKKRPKGKRVIVAKQPTRLYQARDEYGRRLGFRTRKGR